MELTLYSRKWCSWCIDAKDYLTDKGYRFQEIDVGKDRQAYEAMKQLSAQTYVPTFVAGDKVLANFDTNQLEKFLTEHQINPQEAVPDAFRLSFLHSAWPCSASVCAVFKIRMRKSRRARNSRSHFSRGLFYYR